MTGNERCGRQNYNDNIKGNLRNQNYEIAVGHTIGKQRQ